jgi:hypothetical protein
MRKAIVIMIAMLLVSASLSAQALTLSVHANTFTADNEDFKNIYGTGKLLPELKLSVRIKSNFYLWGSYSLLNSTGIDPLSFKEAESTRQFIAGGLMYRLGFIDEGEFAVKAELGVVSISDEEDVEGDIKEGSGIGFQVGVGVSYGFWKRFFVEGSFSYNYAVAEIDDFNQRLGGIKFGLGVGFFLGDNNVRTPAPEPTTK